MDKRAAGLRAGVVEALEALDPEGVSGDGVQVNEAVGCLELALREDDKADLEVMKCDERAVYMEGLARVLCIGLVKGEPDKFDHQHAFDVLTAAVQQLSIYPTDPTITEWRKLNANRREMVLTDMRDGYYRGSLDSELNILADSIETAADVLEALGKV